MQGDTNVNPTMKLLYIVLFIITITLFSTWCYQWIDYVLSIAFGVSTNKTPLDMIIGLLAMGSSMLLFIGTFLAWRVSPSSRMLAIAGSIGFIIKNVLDSFNQIIPLAQMAQVTKQNITSVSWAVAGELLELVFWIIIFLVFFRMKFNAKEAHL